MSNLALCLGEADPISKTRGDHHPALSVNNDGTQAQPLDERHSFLRAHHEDPCRQAVGRCGVGSNNGDALAAASGLRVGAVTSVEEQTDTLSPVRYDATKLASSTPIEAGSQQISATVTVVFEAS